MSLRDYFAARVMQGMCCQGVSSRPEHRAEVANAAYQMADVMIQAREARL
jgi:hypothetical protein